MQKKWTKKKPRFYDYKDPRTPKELNPLMPSSNWKGDEKQRLQPPDCELQPSRVTLLFVGFLIGTTRQRLLLTKEFSLLIGKHNSRTQTGLNLWAQHSPRFINGGSKDIGLITKEFLSMNIAS